MDLGKIKKYIKKYWRWLILIILAVCFFIGTASYNYISQKDGFVKWASPDETANYTFAKLYGQENELRIFEKYNLYAGDIIHPRSMRSDSGKLKPVSFLGMILIFGKIVSWTSYKILPFLTPIAAGVGILFFYLLIKKIFGRRNAFISAFLLASFPVYIYYSTRSMFHNVLFIDLLIIGLYFAVLMIKSRRAKNIKERYWMPFTITGIRHISWHKLVYASLAGGFIGLAIITRTSELLWIMPMLIILWLFNIKKVGFIKLILFLSFLVLSIIPVFYWNQILYGSPANGGYTEMNQSITNIAVASTDIIRGTAVGELSYHKALLTKIKDNLFYFGFHPRQSLKMFYYYFTKMFYWLFWPAVFGFLLFLRKAKKWKRKHWAYLISYFVISLILIFYYGSWEFHDNPDPDSFTIGNSYTRYWLPIYIGALPFISFFIIKLTRLLKKKIYITSGRTAIIALAFIVSTQFVLFGSEEGLAFSMDKHKQARYEYEKVLELTESNSVIITQYHDKLFFPERKVIVGLFNDDKMVARYAGLTNHLPVYYYNFTLPERDVKYLNNIRLSEFGLEIKKVKQVTGDFTLYRLVNF
jgi:hypothetical protein